MSAALKPTSTGEAKEIEALYDRVLRFARADLDAAAGLAAEMLRMTEALGEAYPQGLALRAEANIRYLEGKHEAALERYRQAVDSFEKLSGGSGEEEVARTKNSAIQTLAYLARYEEALQWGAEARAVFERNGDVARLARLDGNLANLYFRLDRFDEALACYERAHSAFRSVGTPQDIAAILSNLATCYISVGRFDDSLRTHRQAREHSAAHGFSLLVAQADYNIAYLYFLRGDHREAMRLYAEARRHASAVGDTYHMVLCDLDQAESMLELNLLDEAERLARAAMRGFRRLSMRYERGKATVYLASALAGRQQREKAIRMFRIARRLFAEEGNPVWPAFIDLHLASLSLQSGDSKKARRLAESALFEFSDRELPGKIILAECILARILLQDGMLPQAEMLCRFALGRAEAMGAGGLRFRCQFLLGEILRGRRLPGNAMAAYQHAQQALEQLRDAIPEGELRIRFFEDKASLFERLVRLHLDEPALPGNAEAAWQCAQNAKSKTFLETYVQRAAVSVVIRDERQSAVWSLRQELQQCYARGSEAEMRGNLADLRTWKQRATVAERRLHDALAELRLDIGGGAELGLAPASYARAGVQPGYEPSAVSGTLPAGTTLLEYFCTPERLYAFVLRRDRPMRAIGLAGTAELKALVRLTQFQISNYHQKRAAGRAVEEHWPALASHLDRLHAALVAPMEEELEGQRLIVAPHGFLHGLPFAALGSRENPLGARCPLLRTLSGSTFAAMQVREFQGKRLAETRGALVLGLSDHRAPFIDQEVRCVAKHLDGAQLLEGECATLEALRTVGANARYIHIASHGLFRADNPMFSAIRLGDGNLTVLDLHEIQLRAELVTLSGCSTGVHAVIGGDELVGFSRGFFHAGARRLLLTLWDVHDASTAAFMGSFYELLGGGWSPEDALQGAAMRLREEYPHPYHWAGFSLMAGCSESREDSVAG